MAQPRRSGIDAFRMKQNLPSAYSLNTGQAGPGALEEMQENYNDFLPPSLQRSTPVGRSRNSPERIAERELRAYSRQLDSQLSPFAQSNMRSSGLSQPQRMSRSSVFGAMQSNDEPQRQAPKRQLSGLDAFYAKQNLPSSFEINQSPNKEAILAEMQQNYNELLPPSLQGRTPVGRSRHSPERIAERELRAKSRQLDRMLSPFY
jgi:hypothetical protein